MGSPISSRVSYEYTPKQGVHFPDTTYRGRSVLPSYANSSQVISNIETITVSIPVGALTSGTSSAVTGTQGMMLNSVSLASYDTGNFLITNVSAIPPANTLVGHPQIQVTSQQGNPTIGALASGQTYSGLSLSVTATVYATGASSAGTLQVTATVLLIGTALGN